MLDLQEWWVDAGFVTDFRIPGLALRLVPVLHIHSTPSMDSATFHARVYAVTRLVPSGMVTSYGHIAKLAGAPRHARHVGQALKFLQPDVGVPWQRVLGSSGQISSRGPGTDGAQRQRAALEAEGVQVSVGRTGELIVNLHEFGWFPATLDLDDTSVAVERGDAAAEEVVDDNEDEQ